MNIEVLLENIGLDVADTSVFSQGFNKKLFELAMTHSSFNANNPQTEHLNNERLEFYGDAVLKLVVSKYLYEKFPENREGVLSEYRSVLVSDAFLAKYAQEIELGKYLNVDKADYLKLPKAQMTLLACAFEAFLGALYMETNFSTVEAFCLKFLNKHIEFVKENILKLNAKAALQEYTQAQSKELPVYTVIESLGKEHDKIFVVCATYRDKIIGNGTGKSKKEAEQAAAYDACVKLGVIDD